MGNLAQMGRPESFYHIIEGEMLIQYLDTRGIQKKEHWCKTRHRLPDLCLTSLFLQTGGGFHLHD